MSTSPSVSLIVTTYNWPEALDRVLMALNRQRVTSPLEVIVADDGSTQMTADLIARYKRQFNFPLYHVWQPDEGFQAAKIRNRAIAKAQHDYVIFLDGDCQPLADFVSNHVKLANKGWFVFGNRVLLSRSFSSTLLSHTYDFEALNAFRLIQKRLKGQINRLLPFLRVPLGPLRRCQPNRWKGVKTCNLAVWRDDLVAVNGLEEAFTGWGYEDSDLVLRLQKFGVKCKDGRFSVPVIHFWHEEQDRSLAADNWNRLTETFHQATFRAVKGVSQYLTKVHHAIC
ncbi:MAG: glycosyltransferase family 2 protein [Gammaproteobacteria bacterium]